MSSLLEEENKLLRYFVAELMSIIDTPEKRDDITKFAIFKAVDKYMEGWEEKRMEEWLSKGEKEFFESFATVGDSKDEEEYEECDCGSQELTTQGGCCKYCFDEIEGEEKECDCNVITSCITTPNWSKCDLCGKKSHYKFI